MSDIFIRQNFGWASANAVALTSNTSIGSTHYGKVLTNRGASGALVHTLPDVSAALNGTILWYRGVADQDVSFSTNTAGQLIVVNNAAATTLSFNQTGKKIGASASLYCDGTSWFATVEESQGAAGAAFGIVGEIKMYGGSSAPSGWLFCDGGTQLIATYPALAGVLGTTYGGDGVNTFGIPDLRGRMPMHEGAGAGLTSRSLGDSAGVESVTLNTAQLPSHIHEFFQCASDEDGQFTSPVGTYPGRISNAYMDEKGAQMGSCNTEAVGSGSSVATISPFLVVNFIIKT